MSVLYGDVNPTGRLPYTIAKKESDYGHLLNSSVSFDRFPEDNFSEGLYIDYRAFDKNNIEPLYEFGFGLSYTSFNFSDFSLVLPATSPSEFPDPATAIVQGGHRSLWDTVVMVKCAVGNTGPVEGAEIAQLYVGIPGDDTPVRQLRGFSRVGQIAPGDTRKTFFVLTRRDLSVWDVVAQQWRLRRGEYTVWIGASSRDLRLNGTFTI